ncbi:MAG: hypothetical protein A2992_04580 [Elusimicrobia bacterium RIFCSPLOWO2_01_FULL_59_12]|nr:MAG: hypothetical protein A2992_04580 [Elusimicrobia bacterium RIFCSPLOWO2_01_FULL_59_12]
MKLIRSLLFMTPIAALLAAPGTSAYAHIPPQEHPTGTPLEQGLWWLYHLKYDEARELFEQYIAAHPKEPAGYFYKTAADWWQLAQQFDTDLPAIRDRLEQDYLATVRVAEDLMRSTENPNVKAKACLYSGGAQGLKGRWLVTQGSWIKAYFLGKNGHKLLKRALKLDPELYDAYLGLGIYDYFTDTLPGVQKVLAALFIRGDRERGLSELRLAIEKGEHARVEAMMFLIEIYTWEERSPAQALPLSTKLHAEFPKSPAMSLAHIMTLYELRDWDALKPAALEYLQRSQKEVPYYRREGTYPARYCLGVAALWGQRDMNTSMKYMQEIVMEDVESSRWVTFAYLRMGQIYDVEGERDKALDHYKKVLSRPDFWGSHNEAKACLKRPFKF